MHMYSNFSAIAYLISAALSALLGAYFVYIRKSSRSAAHSRAFKTRIIILAILIIVADIASSIFLNAQLWLGFFAPLFLTSAAGAFCFFTCPANSFKIRWISVVIFTIVLVSAIFLIFYEAGVFHT